MGASRAGILQQVVNANIPAVRNDRDQSQSGNRSRSDLFPITTSTSS